MQRQVYHRPWVGLWLVLWIGAWEIVDPDTESWSEEIQGTTTIPAGKLQPLSKQQITRWREVDNFELEEIHLRGLID